MTDELRKSIAAAAKIPFCNIASFIKLENAKSFLRHGVSANKIMQVNDEYWVVSPAEAERLNKLGYNYVC